jgi:hypothetical protein
VSGAPELQLSAALTQTARKDEAKALKFGQLGAEFISRATPARLR